MTENPSPSSYPVDRVPSIRQVMMPRDTNALGTIFGGVLLSYIDQAGAIRAHYEIRRAGWTARPIVTVAMNRVEFKEPVLVGDVVCFRTRLVRLGRTSITMHVTVEAGTNPHHMVEVSFKAFARALRQAIAVDPRVQGVPSTKGLL